MVSCSLDFVGLKAFCLLWDGHRLALEEGAEIANPHLLQRGSLVAVYSLDLASRLRRIPRINSVGDVPFNAGGKLKTS
jgi:hypothetical protein